MTAILRFDREHKIQNKILDDARFRPQSAIESQIWQQDLHKNRSLYISTDHSTLIHSRSTSNADNRTCTRPKHTYNHTLWRCLAIWRDRRLLAADGSSQQVPLYFFLFPLVSFLGFRHCLHLEIGLQQRQPFRQPNYSQARVNTTRNLVKKKILREKPSTSAPSIGFRQILRYEKLFTFKKSIYSISILIFWFVFPQVQLPNAIMIEERLRFLPDTANPGYILPVGPRTLILREGSEG